MVELRIVQVLSRVSIGSDKLVEKIEKAIQEGCRLTLYEISVMFPQIFRSLLFKTIIETLRYRRSGKIVKRIERRPPKSFWSATNSKVMILFTPLLLRLLPVAPNGSFSALHLFSLCQQIKNHPRLRFHSIGAFGLPAVHSFEVAHGWKRLKRRGGKRAGAHFSREASTNWSCASPSAWEGMLKTIYRWQYYSSWPPL